MTNELSSSLLEMPQTQDRKEGGIGMDSKDKTEQFLKMSAFASLALN